MSTKILKLADNRIDLSMVTPANEFGGKLLKLKNEFAFADFSMSISELKTLYYMMSMFDTDDFFTYSEVREKLYSKDTGWNYHLLDQRLTDSVYNCLEYRTVILDAHEVSRTLQTTGKSYSTLEKAVWALHDKTMVIDHEHETGRKQRVKISPIEVSAVIDDQGKKQVLVAFSQSFMPYVLAFSGYQKLNMSEVISFKSNYAIRYYHWFLTALSNNNTGQIKIAIDSLRKRFEISDEKHKRGFIPRVVEQPIKEVIDRTGLNVNIKKLKDKTKQGSPVTHVIFDINKK